MEPDTAQPELNRRRVTTIGLIVLLVLGGVTAVGLLTDRGNLRKPSRQSDNSADFTDEELADVEAFKTMPEKDEIEQIKIKLDRRMRKKTPPTFEPESFDRLIELSQHLNVAVRIQAIDYLAIMCLRGRMEPYASDPTSVRQMTMSLELAANALRDISPHVRGTAFRVLGVARDGRFSSKAQEALKSVNKSEREGAEAYFDFLANRRTKN